MCCTRVRRQRRAGVSVGSSAPGAIVCVVLGCGHGFVFNGAGMGREHVGGLALGAMGRVVLGCGVHVGPTVMRVTHVNLHVAVWFKPSTADDHSLSAA